MTELNFRCNLKTSGFKLQVLIILCKFSQTRRKRKTKNPTGLYKNGRTCVVQKFDPAFCKAAYGSFGANGLIKYFQTCNRINATVLYSYTVLGQLYLHSLPNVHKTYIFCCILTTVNLLILRCPRVKQPLFV